MANSRVGAEGRGVDGGRGVATSPAIPAEQQPPGPAVGPGSPAGTAGLEEVIEAERRAIEESRRESFPGMEAPRHLTGLCLSGGGIRSACFNLGLLEGLDRFRHGAREDHPPNDLLRPGPGGANGHNFLEYFDYLSSVSGGSYAAGHLATAMLEPDRGASPGDDCREWLGNILLTSKTVPGWLWGVGVWSLGVAFQLLKTGALLVCVLALIAFAIRIADAPDVMRFVDVLGLGSDVSRGFVPFWLVLWIFLVAYWINASRLKKGVTLAWLVYSGSLVVTYIAIVWGSWWAREDAPEQKPSLPFAFHYGYLMALGLPVMASCAGLLAARGARSLAARFSRPVARGPAANGPQSGPTWVEQFYVRMRTVLLVPILVALFCVAALVTTGDVDLGLSAPVDAARPALQGQERSRELAEAQLWIYQAALSALGLSSLVFFFPKNLFKSTRLIEDRAVGKYVPGFWRRSWEPVFRVVVFLCSYGFVLLVVFVLFSTVAGENISGYFRWRENLPSAAFHGSDFRRPDLAWERIARDRAAPGSAWNPLARRLMAARERAGRTLVVERAKAAEIQALESMPWIVRLFPVLMQLGPDRPWRNAGFRLEWSDARLYDERTEQDKSSIRIAREVADSVLDDPRLHEAIAFDPPRRPIEVEKNAELASRYRDQARALATLETRDEATRVALRASIRNNNRRALQLYLGDAFRPREEKVVFASIVWAQDQWTRIRIFLIAGGVWFLCLAVDVNTFSLQKFYRGHVIDSWVKIPQGKDSKRWLHQAGGRYRGCDHGERGPGAPWRRAPLLLINATLEGNRSLGDEPDVHKDIFTFSKVASGSGETGHWLSGPDRANPLARRSGLDIGNIVTTSGAFLSPGNIANPALSAILHLLNIQTGYWAHRPEEFERRSPVESVRFHFAQSLGIDREGDSRFMLTDGAHVENLGLYVLLQRRCSLIVVSDCSQQEHEDEPYRRFDALIHVLQQAQVDGIEVGPFLSSRAYIYWRKTGKIAGGKAAVKHDGCLRPPSSGLDLVRPPDAKKPAKAEARAADASGPEAPSTNGQPAGPAGKPDAPALPTFSREHHVFAQITYPGGEVGLLVYLRPTLTGDEGDSLLHGATSCRFPDDDPIDQFYTPAKMSTYRLLGRHIAVELMHDPLMADALHRIVAGSAATEGPDYRGEGGEEDGCDLSCDMADLSCIWKRQRLFRPPASRRDGPGGAGGQGDV